MESYLGCQVAVVNARATRGALSLVEAWRVYLHKSRALHCVGDMSFVPWYFVSTTLLLMFKTHDVTLLTSWLSNRLRGVSLFQHRRFFFSLKHVIQIFFKEHGAEYGIGGISIVINGKISVTGNARRRRLRFLLGSAGVSNLRFKASAGFMMVYTATGCLGVTCQL